MNDKWILARREELERTVDKARAHLASLQAICKHVDHERIPRSDTGNYSKADDRYWYDCHCSDCGKRWKEPQ